MEEVTRLKSFVQNNWLGPAEEYSPTSQDGDALKALIVDGEYAYRLVKFPSLLARAMNLPDSSWWHMRALFMHQRLLENPVDSLKTKIFSYFEKIDSFVNGFGPSIYTEAGLICQYYHDEKSSLNFLEKAASAIGFEYSLTGVLGRRTKFQTFDTTQLIVQSNSTNDTTLNSAVPTNLDLNDDVLLDKPSLNIESANITDFNALAILLAQAQHLLTFHAKDLIITEKALAYVNKVLEKPNTWCIYSTGLYLRSKLEATKSRFVERSTLQIQALVDQITVAEPTFDERFTMFFATNLPSPWELDQSQGYMFASFGAFKTALSIFTRRELWDEVISCLIQLGDTEGAEARIDSEMERCPENPKLWCIRGDLRNDLSCYERAWEVSGQRYSRAQRSIGKYWFKKQEWSQAIASFETALALNPLFSRTWFLLGCAALQLDDEKKALQSFSRVVSLEPDNAEAWNNIAAIHLHADRPKDALMALKEASRLDYNNWKIADNYFEVALSSGELLTAVLALRRVAEIREASFDLKNYFRLVSLLSKAVEFVGLEEFEVQSVKRRCLSLVDDVLSKYFTADPHLWLTQADLASTFKDEAMRKTELFRAYRSAKAKPYHNDPDAFSLLVFVLTELAHCIRSDKKDDEIYQLSLMIADIKKTANYTTANKSYQELLDLE